MNFKCLSLRAVLVDNLNTFIYIFKQKKQKEDFHDKLSDITGNSCMQSGI